MFWHLEVYTIFSGNTGHITFIFFWPNWFFFKNYYKKFALQRAKGYRIVQHFAPTPRLCRFTIGFHIANAAALLLQEGNTSDFLTIMRTFYSSFWKKSVRWKKYESYVPSVARKNSVNLQVSKNTQLLFQEIFLWQKFPENVLTYLWERDIQLVDEYLRLRGYSSDVQSISRCRLSMST